MKTRSVFGNLFYWTMALFAAILIPMPAAQAGEPACYKGVNTNEFLKNWLVMSPIPVAAGEAKASGEETQKKAFDTDLLAPIGGEAGVQPKEAASVKIGDKDVTWKLVQSETDEIHLLPPGTTNDNAIAYAWARIEMPESRSALFALGSDDAVKVWLNGKQVHENWIQSAMDKDRDIMRLDLVKGDNRLLLKIQNRGGDWGFVCRFVDSNTVSERLLAAVGRADIDKVKSLIALGIDVNASWHGVTPWQAAKIAGNREMEDFLKSQGANSNLAMPAPEKVIDSFLTEATRGESSGVAVLVSRDGKILFEKGYGYANIENSVPVTPNTKFRIGSITKQFTAAAILRLQEQGKLNVTNKLSQYIPDFPRGDEVTLRHLLTHTSGIHSYTSKPDFIENARLGTTPEALIDSIKKDPFDFAPGEKWDYCNSGYFLLGWIVGKVSGKPYAEYLKTEFFDPLGMANTGIHTATAILKHEASGYSFEDGRFQKALNWDMSKAGGAGAMYSTVEDLYRWDEALFNGKVLSESSLEAAFNPVITKQDTDVTEKKETGYGYGWFVNKVRGLKVIGHGGGLNGFLSDLERYTAQKFTVVVLGNALASPAALTPSSITPQVASLYLWQEMKIREIPVAVTVTPESLAGFEGRYDYGGAILSVTREGNRLFAQLTGQGKLEIYPKSADTFFWKVVEAEVKFVKNDKGDVIKAVHKQNGATIHASKLPDEKEIKLTPAALDAYLGKYDYGNGKMILTVTREGDHMYGQMTGQPKFEIFPKSENEFFWKIVAASVTFVKDASGKVIRATHHQGGQTIEAPKID